MTSITQPTTTSSDQNSPLDPWMTEEGLASVGYTSESFKKELEKLELNSYSLYPSYGWYCPKAVRDRLVTTLKSDQLKKEDKPAFKIAILMLFNAMGVNPHQEVLIPSTWIAKVGHGVTVSDMAKTNIRTKATVEKVQEYLDSVLDINLSYDLLQHRCRCATVKDEAWFRELKDLNIKCLKADEPMVHVFNGREVSTEAKAVKKRYTKSLQELKQEEALLKTEPLSLGMVRYQELANFMTEQARPAISRLLTADRLQKCVDLNREIHERAVLTDDATDKAIEKATNRFETTARTLNNIRLGDPNFYRLTKDYSPRIFDTVYQGVPKSILKHLWQGCVEFDFRRSQLFLTNELFPHPVLKRYLTHDKLWDVLESELKNVSDVAFPKKYIKSALYTMIFGGGFQTILEAYTEDGLDELVAKQMVEALKQNDLFKCLQDVKNTELEKLKKEKHITIDGKRFRIYTFKSEKTGNSIHKIAASALARKLQHVESMLMFSVLQELNQIHHNRKNNQASVHLCVIKHDGVIVKTGSRLKEGSKALGKLHKRLQEAANKAARNIGLSGAPELELEYIHLKEPKPSKLEQTAPEPAKPEELTDEMIMANFFALEGPAKPVAVSTKPEPETAEPAQATPKPHDEISEKEIQNFDPKRLAELRKLDAAQKINTLEPAIELHRLAKVEQAIEKRQQVARIEEFDRIRRMR